MEILKTALITILFFGFLIFIHELGHYLFARLFHVSIKEFSIGMGPKLVYWDSKKTGIRYAICALPIGGYVAMVGEDGENDDPNGFDKKPAWQRLIVTVAGPLVNIIAGFLAIFILCTQIGLGSTTVGLFANEEEYGMTATSCDYGLMLEDTVVKVGNKRVRINEELSYEIMRQGNEPVDLTVLRNGEEVVLRGVVFPKQDNEDIDAGQCDFLVYAYDKNIGNVVKYAAIESCLIVRMCWETLFDLVRGRYSFGAVSGPVGIAPTIGEAASHSFLELLSLFGLISVNLGVMNLLPLPALDGGRTLTTAVEIVTRKRIPPNVEGVINGIGLVVLLGFSVIVMIKDIIQIVA